jgi:hypothetical protein
MTDNSPKNGTVQVVEFPKGEDERTRRLLALVKWRSGQSKSEWVLYLDDDARKHEIEPAKLREMIEAAVEEREKKAREDRGELRRAEKQQDKARREAETKEDKVRKEAEQKQKREEREARKEAERKDKEKQKALAAIVKLPSAQHEAELKRMARRLDEDVETLRAEFDELLGDEAEKIRRGIVEPWDEPVEARELLDATGCLRSTRGQRCGPSVRRLRPALS